MNTLLNSEPKILRRYQFGTKSSQKILAASPTCSQVTGAYDGHDYSTTKIPLKRERMLLNSVCTPIQNRLQIYSTISDRIHVKHRLSVLNVSPPFRHNTATASMMRVLRTLSWQTKASDVITLLHPNCFTVHMSAITYGYVFIFVWHSISQTWRRWSCKLSSQSTLNSKYPEKSHSCRGNLLVEIFVTAFQKNIVRPPQCPCRIGSKRNRAERNWWKHAFLAIKDPFGFPFLAK